MGALEASVYLLTCCRPALRSSFCYYIETPKFINLNWYQDDYFGGSSKCIHHEKLYDHSINFYNTCTDYRAWSLDDGQRRRHFIDVISRHIPHCGEEKHSQEENEIIDTPPVVKKPPKKKEPKIDPIRGTPKLKSLEIEEKILALDPPEPRPPPKFQKVVFDDDLFEPTNITIEESIVVPPPIEESIIVPPIEESIIVPPPLDDSSTLTDEIIEKLDCNLTHLESTFDKFVCKNRDFIQNLIESLNFEKQRQEELKRNHCKIKQENEILRTKNEYLIMVNGKQVEFFKNDLEKAINENKTCFLKQVQHLERIINCNKEELQYYKKNETRLLKIIENEKMELHQLKNDISNLKCKEVNIIKQYIKVLNFLEDIKKTLGDIKGGPHLQRSSNTMCDSGEMSNLDEVLRNALYNGIESLNVRDLSILHDSIQELNQRLCHQNEGCGRNHMSMGISHEPYYDEYNKCTSTDYIHKGVQDFESSLSIVPSRQGPDRTTVHCPQDYYP